MVSKWTVDRMHVIETMAERNDEIERAEEFKYLEPKTNYEGEFEKKRLTKNRNDYMNKSA